jgi:hypothetical protein
MWARTREDWPIIYADILTSGFRPTASFNDVTMDDPDEVLGGYHISCSNAIVVSGKCSPTGAALLSGDPHLGFTTRRVDDRRVISGILHVLKTGLRWKDGPAAYGPATTIDNRFNRWSR